MGFLNPFSYITVVVILDMSMNGDLYDLPNYIHADLFLKYAFVIYPVTVATKVATPIDLAISV